VIVGRTALNKGSRNPPRRNMSLFLPERHVSFDDLAKRCLVFMQLARVTNCQLYITVQNVKTHSLVQFTNSLLQFEMLALRNLRSAVLNTWRV